MRHKLIFFITGAFLAIAISISIARVGKASPNGGTYGMAEPFKILLSLSIPFGFGYSSATLLHAQKQDAKLLKTNETA